MRFDPYRVSSFARKAVIPPERLLKRIRIARAFTCYQMATLIAEKLVSLLHQNLPGLFDNLLESHASSFWDRSPLFWTKMCLNEKLGPSLRGL